MGGRAGVAAAPQEPVIVEAPALSEEEVQALGERGFFLRDGFLGSALAAQALEAAESLAAAGGLRPAGVRRGADHRVEPAVRGDSIAWLEESAEPAFAAVRARFEALRSELNARAYLGLVRTELQLARYPGAGEGYARHRDAFPGPGNRRVTAIVYLHRGWSPASGGALRLFPEGTPEPAPLDVEPRQDRLVLFLSERLEHAVLATWAPRWALTGWFRGP